MEASPRSLAGGTDEIEQVGVSWIKPSSSGHLVPQKHYTPGEQAKASATADPPPGTQRVPEGKGLHRYFQPKPQEDDREPEPEPSVQQPGRLVKPHSATEHTGFNWLANDTKSRRRRSSKHLVSKQTAPVEELRERRRKSTQQLAPTSSPDQADPEKALRARRRRTATQLLFDHRSATVAAHQDRIDSTAVSDDSIGSEVRSSESSDGDDSFVVPDADSPIATAELGYNYLDTESSGEQLGYNFIDTDPTPVVTPQSVVRLRPPSARPHTIRVNSAGHQAVLCSCSVCTKGIAFFTLTACFKDGTATPIIFCGTCCTSPCHCVCVFCNHTVSDCKLVGLCRRHGNQAPQ